jgi:hypothetical protein
MLSKDRVIPRPMPDKYKDEAVFAEAGCEQELCLQLEPSTVNLGKGLVLPPSYGHLQGQTGTELELKRAASVGKEQKLLHRVNTSGIAWPVNKASVKIFREVCLYQQKTLLEHLKDCFCKVKHHYEQETGKKVDCYIVRGYPQLHYALLDKPDREVVWFSLVCGVQQRD